MIDVIYQKKFLKVNQIWYPGKRTVESLLKEKRKADILFVHGAPIEETKGSFRGWQEYHTCRNDLTISEEDMLANINKAVKYQFRRSEKDNIEIAFYTKEDIEKNPQLIETFRDIYERMYRSKGSDTKLNVTAIERYLAVDGIVFSAAIHEGEVLVFHSYICTESQCTSASVSSGQENHRLSSPLKTGMFRLCSLYAPTGLCIRRPRIGLHIFYLCFRMH